MYIKSEKGIVHLALLIGLVIIALFISQLGIKKLISGIQHLSKPQALASTLNPPLIGAIRWDAWFTNGPGASDEIALTPTQWHDRLPFYATVATISGEVQIRLDNQSQMDQEITYAKAGGIDYWAFDYYGNSSPISGALQKYLASPNKSDIKYSLIILNQAISAGDWPNSAISHFQDPQYVKVLGNRPLVYMFDIGGINKSKIDAFRDATTTAGLPNPYIVYMTWNVNDGITNQLGFDAVSAYALAPTGPAESVQPYSNLASVNQQFWNNGKSLGLKVVPLVSTGWDPRPRYAYPPPWGAGNQTALAVGSPQEIVSNLQSAWGWVISNPITAETNTIIMYAWNEFAEGGWLDPLLDTGSARLDAINQFKETADSTLPEVSIQSPIQSTTVSGNVTMSTNATDDKGIAGVQFRIDGLNVGNEVTIAPYNFNWDSSTVTNTTHTITALARDINGLTQTSSPVSVTVNNSLPNQPVGSWNLNQATGTTATDNSGNNNGNLVGGANWVTGKRGSSVDLDGIDDYITIADATNLDSMKAVTLSTWVNLSQLPTQNYVVVGKDSSDASYRIIVGSNGTVSFTVSTNNNSWYSAGTSISSNSKITPNNWKHIVGTYDGSYVRIYINGVLDNSSSQKISGNIFNSASSLRFGFKSSSNIDYTKGRVDEVSLYSVALNPVEVKALFDSIDQNADITPPTVSITSPANNSMVSRNSTVTIQASAADPSGISKVEFYANGVLKCTDTSTPYSCAWIVPPQKGVKYTTQAKGFDTNGNSSTSSSITVTSK